MKAGFMILLGMLLWVPTASAATISGTIYNWETLEPLEGAVVSIDTVPRQATVARNGTYVFELQAGDYTLRAEYYVNAVLAAEANESFTIPEEGEYILDILVLPELNVPEPDPPIEIPGETENGTFLIVVGGLAAALVLAFVVRKVGDRRGEGAREVAGGSEAPVREGAEGTGKSPGVESGEGGIAGKGRKPAEDPDKARILSCIQKEKRLTQKELRKGFPFSEAKMSLILAELEHDGSIRKIKKGRGNVLIAN